MGQEITIQLALQAKPAAFCIRRGNCETTEALVDALNAVRLFGHSQLFVDGVNGLDWHGGTGENGSPKGDDWFLAKICETIKVMQLKGEKIEITTTPTTPAERKKTGFCRIDLRLKK